MICLDCRLAHLFDIRVHVSSVPFTGMHALSHSGEVCAACHMLGLLEKLRGDGPPLHCDAGLADVLAMSAVYLDFNNSPRYGSGVAVPGSRR